MHEANAEDTMKKILFLVMVTAFALAGCQREEDRPVTGGPPGASPLGAEQEIKLLQSVLKEDPDNLNALIRMGNASMDTARYAEAIEAYGRALSIDPSNTDVRVDMGVCYRNNGRPDIAEKEFRKAIEQNPRHAIAHLNLGVVLAYDMQKPREAVAMFERYLELAPNAPNADAIRGEIAKLKLAG